MDDNRIDELEVKIEKLTDKVIRLETVLENTIENLNKLRRMTLEL